jgi:hypothetical protein
MNSLPSVSVIVAVKNGGSIGSGAAVRAPVSSTLFQLPGVGVNNFRMIVALTNRQPCFQLELGSEPTVVPESLGQFMKCLSSQWDRSE